MRIWLKYLGVVLIAVGMNMTALAQMYGPDDVPPLGVTFTHTGTLVDGDFARTGGKTFYYSNLQLASYTDAYWGVTANEVKLSLDGCLYTGSEIMSYSSALSDLPNGVIVWIGQTIINLMIPPGTSPAYTRFTMTVTTDGVTSVPLVEATSLGLDPSVGAVVHMTTPIMAFQAHMLYEASLTDGSGYTPAYDFYNGHQTSGENACLSLYYGWYWDNAPPTLATNVPLVVNEGLGGVLHNGLLLATDIEDPATDIRFTIAPSLAPRNGTLYRSGTPLSGGDFFFQQNIDDGNITYEHDGSETTTDDFVFEIRDGDGELASDGGFTLFNFNFIINPVNDPPVAYDALYTTNVGSTVSESFTADDPDSPTLTYHIVTNGTLATATLLDPNTGAFEYVPLAVGTDYILFSVGDGALSDAATVTISIVNLPPIAQDDAGTTNEGVPLSGTVSATDTESPTLTYAIDTDGAKGTAVIDDANTGAFTYTPDPNAIGEDAFLFTAYDGTDYSTPGTFTVTIHPNMDKGDLLIADQNAGLLLCDPTTAQLAIISTGGIAGDMRRVDMEASGDILVMDQFEGLIRIDPADGTQTVVSAGANFAVDPFGPIGIAVEKAGTIIVADATNGVVRVDPTTGVVTPLSSGGDLVLPAGITLAPNGDIYVTDAAAFISGSSRILRIDPVSGAQTIISIGDNLVAPLDIVVANDGNLVVLDAGSLAGGTDQVIRVDVVTGVQTVISIGGLMDECPAIAIDGDGDFFVTNINPTPSLLDIGAVSGVQTLLVSGDPLIRPFGLYFIPLTCCEDRVGNANGEGGDEPTIGDASVLINAVFIAGTCDGVLECLAEADLNQSGGPDPDCSNISISDISVVIDYLFIRGPSVVVLPNCL